MDEILAEGLLSPRDLAQLLKISLPTAYKWASRGILPSYKLEGIVRFSRGDVLDFLQKRRKVGQQSVNNPRNG